MGRRKLKPVAFPCYALFTHHLVYVNGVKHKLLHLASVWLVCFLLSERNHLYLYRYVTKSKGYKICEKASSHRTKENEALEKSSNVDFINISSGGLCHVTCVLTVFCRPCRQDVYSLKVAL